MSLLKFSFTTLSCSPQFTDTVSGYFFQRIHFDYSNIITGRGNTPILEQAIADLAIRFDLDWNIAYSNKIKRVAVLVSKIDHCLFDLLIRRKSEELKCEIPVVVSNHPDLKHIAGKELARQTITAFALPHTRRVNKCEPEDGTEE